MEQVGPPETDQLHQFRHINHRLGAILIIHIQRARYFFCSTAGEPEILIKKRLGAGPGVMVVECYQRAAGVGTTGRYRSCSTSRCAKPPRTRTCSVNKLTDPVVSRRAGENQSLWASYPMCDVGPRRQQQQHQLLLLLLCLTLRLTVTSQSALGLLVNVTPSVPP